MFENNSNFKNTYNHILQQLLNIGPNFRNDNDKIRALEMINHLKDIAYRIEPQDSVDYYNR